MEMNSDIKAILRRLVEMKEPEILLRGKVDGEMEDYIFWAFAYLRSIGSPDVLIIIDSGGGDSDCGHEIYDVIRLYKGKTTGLSIADVHSAASMVMQACNHRQMTRHARMVIHNPSRSSVSLDTLESPKKHDALVSALRSYQKALIRCYMDRTKKTEQIIKKQLAQDQPMTAEQALSFGLIDEIV
jgi:ATP-dependent protease ClpP protease subunit